MSYYLHSKIWNLKKGLPFFDPLSNWILLLPPRGFSLTLTLAFFSNRFNDFLGSGIGLFLWSFKCSFSSSWSIQIYRVLTTYLCYSNRKTYFEPFKFIRWLWFIEDNLPTFSLFFSFRISVTRSLLGTWFLGFEIFLFFIRILFLSPCRWAQHFASEIVFDILRYMMVIIFKIVLFMHARST